MDQFAYLPMRDHSWMDRIDVEYRFDKIDRKERQILDTLTAISEGVAIFDFKYNNLEQMETRLRRLQNQCPDSSEICLLKSKIEIARQSIKTAPKDRSNLLNQQLVDLRDERRRLRKYSKTLPGV